MQLVIICLHAGVSETCGKGSLVRLKQKFDMKGIGYSCYDVYGYPTNTDPSLVALTDCAARIITSEQQGE